MDELSETGAGADPAETVERLLARFGRTYAQEAGIGLRDEPRELHQLLVLANLLSTRIGASAAVTTARELFAAGLTEPRAVLRAPRRDVIAALGRGGYRRYDERTATILRDAADLLVRRWDGDLRQLRAESSSTTGLLRGLPEFPGIGPTGAAIFAREVQGVWPEVSPFLDRKALDGAARLGLPRDPQALARLVPGDRLPALASALVRVALVRTSGDPLA
ncbi:endonuclease [Kocuria sp.]|uniref:endonuclease n=1 Tax=Kocuria sp. TaxID=1871328 RepID=UPI0026DC68A0|nr:endonuclease [Kocuria sp.]MDO4918807.1 endonuclease [Kocuria sp.]